MIIIINIPNTAITNNNGRYFMRSTLKIFSPIPTRYLNKIFSPILKRVKLGMTDPFK